MVTRFALYAKYLLYSLLFVKVGFAGLWLLVFIQYYNFTLYAMMLNELHDKMTSVLPPTDSRLRPDVRKMEIGDIGKSVELLHIFSHLN